MSDKGQQDNFDTADMTEALNDVTNAPTPAGGTAPGPNLEAAAIARDKGWVAPEAYNYQAYNNDSAQDREVQETLHDLPGWGHKSVRYEWLEEYGDVGPANTDLEEILFRGEHQQRSGIKFDA
jgi:ATP-dependent RNA helicase DDX3X